MAFRFALDAVLRYRENIEHIEELALLKIVQEIAGVSSELQQVENQAKALREERERSLEKPIPAAHLREITEREMQCKVASDALRGRLKQLEVNRLQQLHVYQQAQRNRAALSEIRDRREEIHDREELRQVQKTLDEAHLARRRGGN